MGIVLLGALVLFGIVVAGLVSAVRESQRTQDAILGGDVPPPRTPAAAPVVATESEERLVVNPDWSFERLAGALGAIGFVPRGPPSPTQASFEKAGRSDRIEWVGDPTTAFSALAIRSPNARALVNDVVNGAYVSTAETKIQIWLRSDDERTARLGLQAAEWMSSSVRDARFHLQPLEEMARWGPRPLRAEAGALAVRVAATVGDRRAPTPASKPLAFTQTRDPSAPLVAKDGPSSYVLRVGRTPDEPPFTLAYENGVIAVRVAQWPPTWRRHEGGVAATPPLAAPQEPWLPAAPEAARYEWEGGHEHAPDSVEGWSHVTIDGSGALVIENRRAGRVMFFRARVDRVAIEALYDALRAAAFPTANKEPPGPIVPGSTFDSYRVTDASGRSAGLTLRHHEPASRAYARALNVFNSLMGQCSGGRLGYGHEELPPCVHDVTSGPS